VLADQVVVLRGVLGDVVEVPVVAVQIGQVRGGDRGTERLARSGE
jgi:hypothetical protein